MVFLDHYPYQSGVFCERASYVDVKKGDTNHVMLQWGRNAESIDSIVDCHMTTADHLRRWILCWFKLG
jgi:hypothetical protein